MESQKNKKSSNDLDETKFVELYEVEECLWNVKSNYYHNKQARQMAYQRIGMQLNMTNEEVKAMITYVRTKYFEEKAKMAVPKYSRDRPVIVYVPSVPWFDVANRFLNGDNRPQNTSAHKMDTDSPQQSTSGVSRYNFQGIFKKSSSTNLVPSAQPSTSSAPHTYDAPGCSQTLKHEMNNQDLGERVIQYINQILEEKIRECLYQSVDRFYYFGQNIANHLRGMRYRDGLDMEVYILNAIRQRNYYMSQNQMEQQNTILKPGVVYTIQSLPTMSVQFMNNTGDIKPCTETINAMNNLHVIQEENEEDQKEEKKEEKKEKKEE